MSEPALGTIDRAIEPQRLTFGRLVAFSLPLGLTFLMMSGTAPIITAGITWMHDAHGERIQLAAFLLAFATGIFLYSPVFASRNMAIRTITDRRSIKRFAVVCVSGGLLCSLVIVLVSRVEGIGATLFERLLGAGPEIGGLAREGLLYFAPIPPLIVLRGMAQGCHINNNQTWYVGLGTALRLAVMSVFVFGFAMYLDLNGPVLGGITLTIGVGAEAGFVLYTARGKRQWRTVDRSTVFTYGQFVRYALPLMAATSLLQLLQPLLIHYMQFVRFAEESLASYDLIRGTTWVMLSMLVTVQPAVVAHATSRPNLRVLLRFSLTLVVLTTAALIVLHLPAMRRAVFEGLLELDNERIARLTYEALFWLIPMPLISLAAHFMASLHTRSGRTRWVPAGNLCGLLVVLATMPLIDPAQWNGAKLAVIGLLIYHLTSAVVQCGGLLRGGLAAAVSTDDLVSAVTRPPD